MPQFHQQQISPPKNWQEFEQMSADLWSKIFNATDTNLHGRSGQSQHGVDVFGLEGESGWFGVQCKGKDALYGKAVTEKELKSEVAKAMLFEPPLAKFILATTAPNDTKIQQVAREITEQNKLDGLFTVEVWGWDDIHRKLSNYPELIDKYYPGQGDKTNQLLSDSTQMMAMVSQISEQFATMDSGAGKYNDAINSEIDKYRDLINVGKFATGLNLLIKLKEKSWDELTNNHKFRLTSNMAAAKLSLGREHEAARLYLEAKEFEPENENALCNEVVAYHLLGVDDKAIQAAELAVEKYPKSKSALRLRLATSRNSLNSPEEMIPEEFRTSAEIAYVIGQKYQAKEQLDEAIFWFKTGHEDNGHSKGIKSAYACAMLAKVVKQQHIVCGGQITASDRVTLELITALLSEIWREIENYESYSQYINTVVCLITAKSLLDTNEDVLAFIKSIFEKLPFNSDVIVQYSFQLRQAGNFSAAVNLLAKYYNNAPEQLSLLYIEALTENKQYADALNVLESFLTGTINHAEKLNATGMKLQLLNIISGKVPEELIADALSQFPDSLIMKFNIVSIYRTAGDTTAAIRIAAEAKKLVNENTSYFEKLGVANQLFELNEHQAALPLYDELVVDYADSELLKRLFQCCYFCNHRKKTVELLSKLTNDVRNLSFYRQMAAVNYEVSSQWAEAQIELEEYLKINPADLRELLRWFRVCLRLKQESKINNYLKSNYSFPYAQASDLMTLAHFEYEYGDIEQSITLASTTLLEHFESAEIHKSYIDLLLFKSETADVFTQKYVDIDTAIVIENKNGIVSEYFITDRKGLTLNSIASGHVISKAAMGKQQDDTIEVKSTPFTSSAYKINTVKSKYIYLLHNVKDNFQERFPDYGDVCWPINVKGKGDEEVDLTDFYKVLDGLKEQSKEREKRALEILSDYKATLLPISAVAQLMGKGLFEMWIDLQNSPDTKIFNCGGSNEERLDAFKLMDSKRRFIVDPLILYNLYCFDLLDVVTATLGKLAVTQSCIDFYDQLIRQKEIENKEKGIVATEYDDDLFHKHASQGHQDSFKNQQGLYQWIVENCEIIPAIEKDKPDGAMQKLPETLGPVLYDCLVAAQGAEYCLLTEDSKFRLLSKVIAGVDGLWLQVVLMKALEGNIMSLSRYADMVAKLIRFGFYFTALGSRILEEIAKNNNWQVADELTCVLAKLGGDGDDLPSSFRVAFAEACIYSNNPESCIYATLNAITNNYCREESDLCIQSFIKAGSALTNKKTSQLLLSIIYKWCQGHFVVHKFFQQ